MIGQKLPATLELGVVAAVQSDFCRRPSAYTAARQDTVSDYKVLAPLPPFRYLFGFLDRHTDPDLSQSLVGIFPAMEYVSIFEDPVANLKMFLIPALLSAIG